MTSSAKSYATFAHNATELEFASKGMRGSVLMAIELHLPALCSKEICFDGQQV